MLGTFLALGIIGVQIGLNYLNREEKKSPTGKVQLPRTDEGTPITMIYGRCRVDEPILAWTSGSPLAVGQTGGDSGTATSSGLRFHLDMFFVLGSGFEGGATNRLHNIFVGGDRIPCVDGTLDPLIFTNIWTEIDGLGSDIVSNLVELTGEGNYERNTRVAVVWNDEDNLFASIERPWTGGEVEFLNGNESQHLVDPGTFAPVTRTGEMMIDSGIDGEDIPGYRGFLSCSFSGVDGIPGGPSDWQQWVTGFSHEIPPYTFEASSYPTEQFGNLPSIGDEANPVDVIFDLLTGKRKLGLSSAYIDMPNWTTVAETLHTEGNGYSRAIAGGTAEEIVNEVLAQIDGVLRDNPSTGKLELKLIRGDYDPATVPHITPDNAVRIDGYEAGGWTDLPNKVRIVFTDRDRGYQDNSATAHNMANAVGQDGQAREITINMPGVCTETLARSLAARELATASRPMAKCTARVDRSFQTVLPGDVVALTWPEYGVDGKLFRVLASDYGDLRNGTITLSLVEDVFYASRGIVIISPPLAGFPSGSLG